MRRREDETERRQRKETKLGAIMNEGKGRCAGIKAGHRNGRYKGHGSFIYKGKKKGHKSCYSRIQIIIIQCKFLKQIPSYVATHRRK